MGTNYYWMWKIDQICSTCGHRSEQETRQHIGKSSAGWTFGLHVYPSAGIHTLEAWIHVISVEYMNGHIENEYGKVISLEKMLITIINRQGAGSLGQLGINEEWYRQNYAEPGPQGLSRRKIGGGSLGVVGHGEGTWDYIEGDFS
jgi:hypothetical protein